MWYHYAMGPFSEPITAKYTTATPWYEQEPGAKTINVFRACLGAQLTICAQKWRNVVLFSTASLRFVLSRVCVFLYSLGPRIPHASNVAFSSPTWSTTFPHRCFAVQVIALTWVMSTLYLRTVSKLLQAIRFPLPVSLLLPVECSFWFLASALRFGRSGRVLPRQS